MGREDRVDHGDLEFFDILLAALLQHGHTHRVVLVHELALQLERIGQDEGLERIERTREVLILRLEGTLCGADVLDALDDGGFLRSEFLVEIKRGRDLDVDDVDQRYDDYAENDLKNSFHFINKYLLLILCSK